MLPRFWIAGRRLTSTPCAGKGVGALGEVEGDDRGQQLGREAHGEGDREEERFEDRAVQPHVDGEDRDDQDRGDAKDEEPEGPHATLEVVLRGALGKPLCDLAVARPRPGGSDDCAAGAADDARAEEEEAVAVVVASGIECPFPRCLGGRCRLAGERGFIDVEMVGLDDAAIGRHDIPSAQDREVAADDVVDWDLSRLSVPHDGRPEREARLERGDRRFRARFLDEPEGRAHDDDGEDDRGIDHVADDEAHQARADEDQDERAGDLGDQDRESCPPPAAADRVRAVRAEAVRGLGGGQPGRRGRLRSTPGRDGRGRAGSGGVDRRHRASSVHVGRSAQEGSLDSQAGTCRGGPAAIRGSLALNPGAARPRCGLFPCAGRCDPVTAAEGVPLRKDIGRRRDGSDRWAWLLSPRRSLDRTDAWLLAAIAIAAFVVRVIPVLIGGGLLGLQGYDDGVYFGAASSLIHGVIPYRDFLLLHPPGIVLALTPFALLGTIIGDPAAFAVARVSFMALGAMNAVLVALVGGRYGRLAGLIAGGLYAVWNTSANAERTADLLALENALLLLGLLALTGRGRITPRWAALAGIALGLALTVHLWQAISAAILLWWVVVRARGDGWDRARPALAFLVAAGIAFGLVCLPFIVAAPEAMVRYVLVDQLGRPSVGIGLTDRLLELAGLTRVTTLPAFLRPLVSNIAVVVAAAGGLAVVLVTAWRLVWTRPWAAMALAQTAVVLSTPSFFHDYPAFAAPATTLVVGTGLAAAIGVLARRGMRPIQSGAAIIVVLTALAASSLVRPQGDRLSLASLEQDVLRARCVSSDTPALLVLTSALRRNLEAGCPLVLDPTGTSYDTDRGRLIAGSVAASRQLAPGYQQAMLDWYTSGDAALFARPSANGLTAATEAAIQQRLPFERRRGIVTVRLARSP